RGWSDLSAVTKCRGRQYMLIKPASDIRASEITSENIYFNRRKIFALAAGLALAGASITPARAEKLSFAKSPLSTDEKPTTFENITSYNNFYEFGVDKSDPAANAHTLTTTPWRVKIDGLVANPADYALEDILKPATLEERVYRHRCVEGWSMVIPWVGFPLADFIKKCEPTSKAKFVEFTTLNDLKQMPGLRSDVLRWPYVEGLRMDEAMHPLT